MRLVGKAAVGVHAAARGRRHWINPGCRLHADHRMDAKKTLVVVRMHVKCVKCGHHENDTYEFDLPIVKVWRRMSPEMQ
jgi:hypothetical protein